MTMSGTIIDSHKEPVGEAVIEVEVDGRTAIEVETANRRSILQRLSISPFLPIPFPRFVFSLLCELCERPSFVLPLSAWSLSRHSCSEGGSAANSFFCPLNPTPCPLASCP